MIIGKNKDDKGKSVEKDKPPSLHDVYHDLDTLEEAIRKKVKESEQ